MADGTDLRSMLEAAGGTVGCDVCGTSNVEVSAAPVRLAAADDAPGLEVVTVICNDCSAIQLYSYPQLEKLTRR
jgi:RNase P subunit RPR2